jgi:hypothetical protein
MPESQAMTRLGQHAGLNRLVDRREQVRHAAVQHDRKIRNREVHAQQGRRPQHVAHRPSHEAKPVRYGRGQGTWH